MEVALLANIFYTEMVRRDKSIRTLPRILRIIVLINTVNDGIPHE